MNILVCGGTLEADYVLDSFRQLGNRVVVMNKDENTLASLSAKYGIVATPMDPTKIYSFELAHVDGFDLVVALTDSDADNFVICKIAKDLFHIKKAICTVNNPTNVANFEKMGVDSPISASYLLAERIEGESDVGSLTKTFLLEDEKIVITEVKILPDFACCGKTLMALSLPKTGSITCIFRDPEVILPHGNTVIEEDDHLVMTSTPEAKESLLAFLKFGPDLEEKEASDPQPAVKKDLAYRWKHFWQKRKEDKKRENFVSLRNDKNILLCGGKTEADYVLGAFLKKRNNHIVIINDDLQTVERMSEHYGVNILVSDPTKIYSFEKADVTDFDLVVSLSDRDADNFVTCMIAKELFHIKKAICTVNNPNNVAIFSRLGIDSPISASYLLKDRIKGESDVDSIFSTLSLENDKLVITEILINKDFPCCGKSLKDINLPHTGSIACIFRDPDVIIPRGDSVFQNNDRIILASAPEDQSDLIEFIKTGKRPASELPSKEAKPARSASFPSLKITPETSTAIPSSADNSKEKENVKAEKKVTKTSSVQSTSSMKKSSK
ncbi:MAG: NAD-binding protein [Eubacteriales bacterium]|nr:NAD-binding protein [Eubacteriales bacterium]